MPLLLIFALVAGAATALSPCALPVLPVVSAAGITGGRRRPLGIATGLALSFTFATIVLVYAISALGLPDNLLRTFAIAVLLVFGLSLLVPRFAARIEAFISRFTAGGARWAGKGVVGTTDGGTPDGFWSGVLVGGGLGFVYAPCAGPILAGVITASAAQDFSAGRLAVALAYGVGSAVTLYVLMFGGRALTTRLTRSGGWLQPATGAVMVLVAVAMFANLDTRFETAIAADLPAVLVNPTKSLEDSDAVRDQIATVNGRQVRRARGGAQAAHGSDLPHIAKAPRFVGNQRWFNTPGGRPLTLDGLRGKVVLVDFWTYTCINCIRTLPYLNAWYERYHSDGFTIVGVHTPEFPFEKSAANVQAAINQNKLGYPVVQDNNYKTWNAYGNQYWPADYLIDSHGTVRYTAFGEGDYDVTERAIRSLLVEAGHTQLPAGDARVDAQAPSAGPITPESYLGAARATRFANGVIAPGTRNFGSPRGRLARDELRYGGKWAITDESATAGAGSTLDLRFRARRVFLVLGSPGATRNLHVLLDGKPIAAGAAGPDVHGGVAHIGPQRLYRLVDLPTVQTHTLTLQVAPGIAGYAFTFG